MPGEWQQCLRKNKKESTSSLNNFLGFLEDTLDKLKSKTVSLLRLESGFFQTILEYIEQKGMDYVVAAKFSSPIQKLIATTNNWLFLNTGIEICEQQYQSASWDKPRRIVLVRQRIKDRPQAAGKQLRLFLEEEIYRNYRYSAYVTEAALTFAMIAYNLMALFRTFVLQEKTQKTLSTLRYRTFAIGA